MYAECLSRLTLDTTQENTPRGGSMYFYEFHTQWCSPYKVIIALSQSPKRCSECGWFQHWFCLRQAFAPACYFKMTTAAPLVAASTVPVSPHSQPIHTVYQLQAVTGNNPILPKLPLHQMWTPASPQLPLQHLNPAHGGSGLYLADEAHNFLVLRQKKVLSDDQQGRAIRGPQPQAARLSSLNLTHTAQGLASIFPPTSTLLKEAHNTLEGAAMSHYATSISSYTRSLRALLLTHPRREQLVRAETHVHGYRNSSLHSAQARSSSGTRSLTPVGPLSQDGPPVRRGCARQAMSQWGRGGVSTSPGTRPRERVAYVGEVSLMLARAYRRTNTARHLSVRQGVIAAIEL
ncbi:hypothetical protein BDW22DRAFT_1488528 [Trametopsis cervina]|nr:hypothetical protein BDW22DRAFT_1488528 [Trametopsis cervina]